MPDSSNNNTNELSSGSNVGLNDFSNYTSRALDVARSRGNYQTAIKDDKQLQAFRDTVYKMVSTWLYEDKIRIVAEYGDSEFLKKNPSEKDLNAVCTESLIIHLPKSDLQKLVADTRVMENKLKKEVKAAEDNRAAIASAFTPKTAQDYIKAIDSNNAKKIEKAIQQVTKEFVIPKDIKRQFSKLAKELQEVLDECYTGASLATLGNQMGLDLNAADSILKNSIINKTLLYVALVTGASKSTAMQNAFVDAGPYNSLLHFTSYSYLTGEPGMDMNAWKKLRDDARRAKLSIRVLTKMRKERASTRSAAYKSISGGNRRASQILTNDTGILKDATMDELITLAGRYGINTRNRNIGAIKKDLYRAIAANNKAISNANDNINYALRRGKMPNQYDSDIVSIRGAGLYSKPSDISDSAGLPMVKFSVTGERITEKILNAVPVYVIGNGSGANSPVVAAKTPWLTTGSIDNNDLKVVGNRNDTLYNRKTSLTGKDLAMFTKIMSFSDAELADFEAKTLRERYSVKGDVISDVSSKSPYLRRAYDVWMYGDCSSSKALSDYALAKMGATRMNNYRDGNFLSRTFKAENYKVKDFTKVIINPIKNIARQVKNHKTMRGGGHISNFEDLPQAAQDFYYTELAKVNKSIAGYISSELTGYYQLSDGDGFWGVGETALRSHIQDNSTIKDTLIMLKAWMRSQKMLANYLEGQIQIKYPDLTIKKFRYQRSKRTALKDFFTSPVRAMKAILGDRGTRTNENRKTDILGGYDAESVAKDNGISLGSRSGTGIMNNANILSGTNSSSIENVNTNLVQVGDNADYLSINGEKVDGDQKSTKKNGKKGVKSEFMSVNSKKIGISKDSIYTKMTIPSYIVNSELDTIANSLAGIYNKFGGSDNNIIQTISNNVSSIGSSLTTLKTGLSTATFTGYGAGKFAFPGLLTRETAQDLSNTASGVANASTNVVNAESNITKSHTGAKITRFASGGTASITGDAAGSNIFANGAKPELVQSNGDMTVTPLNKAGSSTKSQNVKRMTVSERNSALATAISSHVVKLAYTLPSGAQDVTNPGEAIKVYDVKPGITDAVDTGQGGSVSLIGLVANIYSQLTALAGLTQTSGTILNAIAANTSKINSSSTNTTGGNPFAGGFPTSLDSILAGE